MTLLEIKQKSSSILKSSLSVNELDLIITKMKEFVKQKWLDDENRSTLESMLCKLQIKNIY